ncbi:MAG: HYR domain-containing protein [Bacteroidia bacterium]
MRIDSIHVSQTAFTCANVGNNSVILTAYDISGNTSTCAATVTILDVTAPVVTCPANVSVSNDPGQCGAVVVFGASATDNCSATLSLSHASGGVFNVGVTTVTATATDPSGNTAACSFTVTVNDTEAPTITCNDGGLISGPGNSFDGDVTLPTDADACTAFYEYDNPASDNCPGFTVSQASGLPSGSDFPVGVTLNTFVVTDASGNTASCSFNVTVLDGEAPVVSCPASLSVSSAPGQCNAVATYSASATDNCSATVSLSPASGSVLPVGTTTVTATATDPSGNAATCTFTVTVVDNQAPVALCQGVTVVLDANDSARVEPSMVDAGSTDNCGVDSVALDICNFYCHNTGATTVTLTVFDAGGNSGTCTAVVTTLDQTAPVAVCQDITVQLDNTGLVEVLAPDVDGGSHDNCELDSIHVSQTAFNCSNTGANTVVLTAYDLSGNTSTCTAVVTVEDNDAPVATCPANTTTGNDPGQCSAVVSYSVSASDNCSATTTVSPASGSVFATGTTTVTATATDPSGNTASCSFTVTVLDNENPTVACPPTSPRATTPANARQWSPTP